MEKEMCALCKKGRLISKKVDQQFDIGRDVFAVVGIEALVCDSCGETFYSADAMTLIEMVLAEAIANSGSPSGAGFKYMRKVLGLRAVDVAKAFDVTPETISQWETAKREMPRVAFLVMARIVEDVVSGDSITAAKVAAELRALERQPATEPIVVDASKKRNAG